MRQIVFALGMQALASTVLLGLGGWLVISGQLTLGQLVAAELIVTINRRLVRQPRQTHGELLRIPLASAPTGPTIPVEAAPHVLLVLSRDPSQVLREVARQVGITERAVQRIIADLEEEGFIERERVGRQNRYVLNTRQALRHHLEAHHTIGELLALIDSQ